MNSVSPLSSAPMIDVHAHVLLPRIENAVAGHPALAAARALEARRNGPKALARTVWEQANAGTAEHVAQAPERLHGLGLVPLQHPAPAVEALDHALGWALRGVEISSHAPGRELSDPAYERTVLEAR
ncbi:amidohydrolase family protein [[Actinomadura] parvosata]|uniref:amidohydrolase family protein n=1 Tax=[Actinomadura] parvosata TaxID=1955412 RepID=UPI00406CFA81